MTTLLYLEASPRGTDSVSSAAAEQFLSSLPESVERRHRALFDAELPPFGATLAAAKYALMRGESLRGAEADAWSAVEALVTELKGADYYLLSVPMWNFGIPYVLKQYIDLVTHPGLTFVPTAEGMQGLVGGRATVIMSRGGDYSPKNGELDPFDLQTPYLRAWLSMVGIEPVEEVFLERTMAGPDAQSAALEAAKPRLNALAAAVVP